MSEKLTLAPCPFCGGEAELMENNYGFYYADCKQKDVKKCPIRPGNLEPLTKEKAIEVWNHRAPRKIVYPEKRGKEKGLGITIDWAWKDGFNWAIDEFRRLNGEER